MITRRNALACLAATPLALSATAQANLIKKPVRWVIPYPAGGGSDFMARVVAQPLGTLLSQTISVDNKPGGNGAIAVADVMRAAADGHTLINVDNGTLVFNPALYKKQGYEPWKDLKLFTLLARLPMLLAVGPSSTAKTAQEFIEYVRARPGEINFASAGSGTPQHMNMEMLMHQAKPRMTHIPYKGSAPALSDVVGGQATALITDYAPAAGFLQSGKLRALATVDTKRHPRLPNLPTFGELGIQGMDSTALVGVAVHASTPDAVVQELQQAIAKALQEPGVRTKYMDVGLAPSGNTPKEFSDIIAAETARWHPLIRKLGITLD